MKIGYLIPEFPGQTHIWVWRERRHLIELGFDVRLASTRKPNNNDQAHHSFAATAKSETFYLWPMSAREVATEILLALTSRLKTFISCVCFACRLWRDDGPSIISTLALIPSAMRLARWVTIENLQHLHVATPSNSLVVSLLAKRFLRRPITIDVAVNADINWWGGGMKTKLGEVDAVFAVSNWIITQIQLLRPHAPFKNVTLARHGVDVESWPKREEKIASNPFRVITVGRLHQGKGHEDLINAISLLTQRGVNVRLQIIGEGQHRSQLEELIERLQLQDRIILLGSLPEEGVKANLAHADAFSLASHSESLGVVYMEAMATGVPVVGTCVGGVPEVIVNDECGLLVPTSDPAAIAAALSRIIEEPDLASRLTSAGRERVEKLFDSRIGAVTIKEVICRVAK